MTDVFIKRRLNDPEMSTKGKPERCLLVSQNGDYQWLLQCSFRGEGAKTAWLVLVHEQIRNKAVETGSRNTQGIFL